MVDGGPNCRGPLVFELTLPNERYITACRQRSFDLSVINVCLQLKEMTVVE